MNDSCQLNGSARIAIIASLILLGSGTVAAQVNSGIPQSPPAKIEGKFAISHSDRDDRTVVALAHQKVGGEKACAIWVSAGYAYVGKPLLPDRVYISFVRDSTDKPRLLKSEPERMLTLIMDGETLTLGPMPSV